VEDDCNSGTQICMSYLWRMPATLKSAVFKGCCSVLQSFGGWLDGSWLLELFLLLANKEIQTWTPTQTRTQTQTQTREGWQISSVSEVLSKFFFKS